MPDAGKNAVMTYSGDGTTKTFLITFAYSERDDLTVKVDRGSGLLEESRPTLWDYDTAGTRILFVTAPPSSPASNIQLTRETDHPTPNVTFTDGAPVTAAQLTAILRQGIYFAEEVRDLT